MMCQKKRCSLETMTTYLCLVSVLLESLSHLHAAVEDKWVITPGCQVCQAKVA